MSALSHSVLTRNQATASSFNNIDSLNSSIATPQNLQQSLQDQEDQEDITSSIPQPMNLIKPEHSEQVFYYLNN